MKKMYIVSLLVVILDRITKIVVENLLDGKVIDVIKNFFYFHIMVKIVNCLSVKIEICLLCKDFSLC